MSSMSEDQVQTADHGLADYAAAVEWITGLVAFGIRPGLKRMELMMERLGHPERRLKFIHVAGTNGKGSTCAYLTRVLVQNGYDTGTFTSPYIEKYTNRIQYNGRDIPEEDLLRLSRRLKPLVEEIAATELGSPTMFEVSTVLALLYFATVSYPDYVVWETGLGGRLDSTNVVTPVLSIITNVGHDHMEILGDTLGQVAAEKAGIIKAGVPVITAVEQPEVLAVIEQAAKAKNASLYAMGRQFRFEPVSESVGRQAFRWEGPFRSYEDMAVGLNGYHQLKNASVALMALEVLRQYNALVLEDEDVQAGFVSAKWPGRLELVSEAPRVLLDGAHNPEGAETLAQALRGDTFRRNKLHFMMGMLSTKNHTGYLRHILPLVDTLILTEPDVPKKQDAGSLAELVRSLLPEAGVSPEIVVERDWKKALSLLIDKTGPEDLAVVSGTLYLISDVRTWMIYKTDSEKGW
ncbi:bifunctional folylpolyglutamate synthase/dihydrofolate synthase [Gorillibacterium sp. sgz5001074]|uniref:bifunctional folylpolyglutamate synthase/dihydrofolate synthase n=1 Tax=Gorillibacterium sp. sgz5001074 TaxID=3446695 RepID=UPI003F66A174